MRIPSINEAAISVAAAWGVLRGREGSIHQFDVSKIGYWRSFGVLLYVYLLWFVDPNFIRSLVSLRHETIDVSSLAYAVIGYLVIFVSSTIVWFAYPYVLQGRASKLGIEATVDAFIVVRNWSVLLITIIGMLVDAAFGWISSYIGWIITLWGIWVIYNVARRIAQASVKTAVLIIGLEYLVAMGVFILLSLLFSILAGFTVFAELLSALV